MQEIKEKVREINNLYKIIIKYLMIKSLYINYKKHEH